MYKKSKQMQSPIDEGKLVYKKLNYKEHILKPSHNIDELLSLVGEDEKDAEPFLDVDDVEAFAKELRNSAWER